MRGSPPRRLTAINRLCKACFRAFARFTHRAGIGGRRWASGKTRPHPAIRPKSARWPSCSSFSFRRRPSSRWAGRRGCSTSTRCPRTTESSTSASRSTPSARRRTAPSRSATAGRSSPPRSSPWRRPSPACCASSASAVGCTSASSSRGSSCPVTSSFTPAFITPACWPSRGCRRGGWPSSWARAGRRSCWSASCSSRSCSRAFSRRWTCSFWRSAWGPFAGGPTPRRPGARRRRRPAYWLWRC